jgi:SAM-dependent methyltransferase
MTEASFLTSTRTAYNTIAATYTERFRGELVAKPLDRAILAAFADLVRTADAGPVVDAGCGPGLVTAHLHVLGLEISGLDLSPEMVEQARRAHPQLRFDESSMTAMDLADGTLGGLVAWYSTIHTPVELLPALFSEFHRVLAPGGYALLAFQTGDEERHLTQWLDHAIELDFYLRTPDSIAGLLSEAGFIPVAQLLRSPDELERAPRACLVVRKPPAPDLATSPAT